MEPKNRISVKALTVWRISGILAAVIWMAAGGGAYALIKLFDWPGWLIPIVGAIAAAAAIWRVAVLPPLRWKRWRYEVRESEIEVQSGLFVITRTLVPMIRVQHVETKQGPLLRKYGLATVEISTAATLHEIPALELAEADDLRFYISKMASVEEEDV